MSIKVRRATLEDAQIIWAFITELAEFERLTSSLGGSVEMVRKWLFEEPIAQTLIAEWESQPVGYAIYFPTLATFKMRPGLWLEDLYVQKAHRGKGLGKALIESVISEAREKGYARVDWSVLDWNENAIDFYQRLGAEMLPDWRICRYSL